MDKINLLLCRKPNSASGYILPPKNRITDSLLMINLFWNSCTMPEGARNS
jgi:hypothetical protein